MSAVRFVLVRRNHRHSRDWVYLTTSKIEERVKILKQWYSFYLKLNFEWLGFLIFLFFLGFINLQPSIFRIGDGIKRHDAIISLREKLFWGIFIGLLISIISGMILIRII